MSTDDYEEDPELALALQLSKEEALRDEERRKQNKSLDIVGRRYGKRTNFQRISFRRK